MTFGWCQGGTHTLERSRGTIRVVFVPLSMKKGLMTSGHNGSMLSSSEDVPQGMTMGPILRIKDYRREMRFTC